MRALVTAIAAISLVGCAASPSAYKVANALRLAAVEPRLKAYSSTQPADEQQRVSDLLASWGAEVQAQAKNK